MDNLNNTFWQNLQIANIYRDKVAHTYAGSFVAEVVKMPPPTIYFRATKNPSKTRHFSHEVSLHLPYDEFAKKVERLFMEFATGAEYVN